MLIRKPTPRALALNEPIRHEQAHKQVGIDGLHRPISRGRRGRGANAASPQR